MITTFLLYESALLIVGFAWIHWRLPRLRGDVVDDVRRLLAWTRRSWGQESTSRRLGLGFLVAVGLALRLVYLRQPMRYDEAVTYVHYASTTLVNILSNYGTPNNHVLNTLLMWVSSRVLGDSPPVLRLPALLSGLAIIPAVYVVGRRLASPGAAMLGTALIAATPCMVLFSTEARGYSAVTLAFLVLLALGTVVDVARPSSFSLAFAVTTALGMFTIPTMLYPAGVAVGMTLLLPPADVRRIAGRARRLMDAVVLAVVITLALYGPILVRSGWRHLTENRFVTPLGWEHFFHGVPGFLTSLPQLFALGFPTAVVVLLGLAILASIALPGRHTTLRRLATIALVWCAIVLLATRRPPADRVWLFLVPILALMAGEGMSLVITLASRGRTRRAWLVPLTSAAIAVALGVGMIQSRAVLRSDEGGTFLDASAVARALLDIAGPRDCVLASWLSGGPLDYYLVTDGGHPYELYARPSQAERLIIVVDRRHGESIEEVLRGGDNIDWDRFSTPKLLERIGSAEIWVSRNRANARG